MTGLRALAYRFRHGLIALAVSVAVHAALIVGVPGAIGAAPTDDVASYSVELTPLSEGARPGATVVDVARPPRPPRPRSPRKPTEAIATLPLMSTYESDVATTLSELAPPPPPLAPEEEPSPSPSPAPAPAPEVAKPEMLASAAPAAAIAEAKAAPFPVAALPPRLTIRYALTSAFADGVAEYSWKRDGDRYEISGSAQAEGFFTLFLEGRILQESTGKVTDSGLRPDRFVERKPQGPEESLTFDWDKRTVEFKRNNEVKPGGLADNTVDWLSMIFQLAHEPPKGDSMSMRVYTQRKMYAFELKVLGEEEIELPIGTVRALHLRHATQEPMEQVDVWLGVEQHYLPVKMRYPVARNRFMVEQTATSITSR